MTKKDISMADAILGRVADAAAKGDWTSTVAAVEQLLASVALGARAGDAKMLDKAAEAAALHATTITLRQDVVTDANPAAAVWLLRAASAVAFTAGRALSREQDGDTRSRILDRLGEAGAAGMTNVELAAVCERAVETVSRELGKLRAEKLTEFASVGRYVQNWLAGAREVEEPLIVIDLDPQERFEPTTLALEVCAIWRREPELEANTISAILPERMVTA